MPIDWSGLLSDSKVLSILKELVARNVTEILPTVTNDGRIVYSDLGGGQGENPAQTLDSLAAAGVLEKRTETRLLACPVHESAMDLMPRARCPACNSMRIKKGTLYQHTCGNISPGESFTGKCPKCGKPSPESSLKLVGVWWECEDCKTKSAAPSIFLYCRKGNHDFPAAQARLVDQASYKLTAEAASELKQRLSPMIGIVNGLQARGIKVRMSEGIMGKSGVLHTFDLVLEKDGLTIPVDVKVATDGEVQVIAVLATYAKVLDVGAKPSVMVAIPVMSADARRTASAYGMLLVEGREPAAIVERLLNDLAADGPIQVSREAT